LSRNITPLVVHQAKTQEPGSVVVLLWAWRVPPHKAFPLAVSQFLCF